MKERLALIDMDIPIHAVSAACDGKFYNAYGNTFQYKKDAVTYCKEMDLDVDMIEVAYKPETWEDCRYSLNSFIDNILSKAGCTFHKGFITGADNFRYDVGKILPYKGNRVNHRKPLHFDACRQHIIDCYDGVVCRGYEADDALGMDQKIDGSTVICSIDKDLLQIPGLHYNWNKEEIVEVNEVEGLRFFFKQMLTGDKTDNILGIHGIGPKSTHLKKIDKMHSFEEMCTHVFNIYKQYFGSYALPFMEENGGLLWIWRKMNDKWWEFG